MFVCVFYVFFFKQKTAYEMRISDWSSDVCSSDLQVLFPRIHELATTGATSFHCGTLATPISVMLVEHDRAGDLLASLRAVTGGYAEIGRASCRERVCQYV